MVHAHGLRAGALTAIAVTAIRPTVHDTRPALVVTVHNAPPGGGVTGAIYRVLELIVARTADSVLCVSADTEQRMRAAGARRVGRAVVPAARPTSAGDVPLAGLPTSAGDVPADPRARIRAEFGAARGQAIVLGACLAPQKGFGLLLDAAARWGDIQPEPLLVIAGQMQLSPPNRWPAGRADGRPAGPQNPTTIHWKRRDQVKESHDQVPAQERPAQIPKRHRSRVYIPTSGQVDDAP